MTRGRRGRHVYVTSRPTAPSLSSPLSPSFCSVSSRQRFGASHMFEDGIVIIMNEIKTLKSCSDSRKAHMCLVSVSMLDN